MIKVFFVTNPNMIQVFFVTNPNMFQYYFVTNPNKKGLLSFDRRPLR